MSNQMTVSELAKFFDHTLLKADATEAGFQKLCDEAKKYGFMMVAINSYPVALCKRLLDGSDVHVGAAISFPLGQTTIATKVFETEDAIKNGADEIDYVINIGALKDGKYQLIKDEMNSIVDVCRKNNVISKVIFENCYLEDSEKKKLAEIALEVKPDFIKTSTGFGTGGATIEDIKLMKSVVGDEVKIKAAGGVRTLDMVLELIDLGVKRIGSSSCIPIVEEYKKKTNQ